MKNLNVPTSPPKGGKKWLPDWRTFFSALLIVFAFPPWNIWPFLWICLIPWLAAIKRARNPMEAGIQGIWLSYFMSLGGFYWVAFVLREFGNLPWFLSILGLQLFCIFGQPQFFVFAPLLKTVSVKTGSSQKKHFPLLGLLLGLSYAGIDWLVPKLFLDTLGHGFYLAKHIRQLADLGGASVLTFLIYIVNDSIWNIFQTWKEKKKFVFHPQFAITLFLCVAGWGYGSARFQGIANQIKTSQKGIQVAAIQANIGDFDKIAAERGVSGAATRVIDTYTQMTDLALKLDPKPELIIWPETSYPSTFRNPHTNTELELDHRVDHYARQIQVPLFFGGYDRVGKKDYNAFFFLSPKGDLQTYRKNVLLLFGEYIPGADSIDFLKSSFPQVGNFGRGIGPDVLEVAISNPKTSSVRFGPIICYEALFADYVAEAARKGSQVIMNITNDSWFGQWGEPQLHLALTTFRSIETHLPMVRSTNTGISTLILPDGEITHATDIGRQQIMNVYVPIIEPLFTLVKAWGNWFGSFAFFAGLMGLLTLHFQSVVAYLKKLRS